MKKFLGVKLNHPSRWGVLYMGLFTFCFDLFMGSGWGAALQVGITACFWMLFHEMDKRKEAEASVVWLYELLLEVKKDPSKLEKLNLTIEEVEKQKKAA